MSTYKFCALWLKDRVDCFLHDEKGEVNIVAIVVLIGIAVVLAIVFKDAIGELITDLLDTITGNAKKAATDPVAPAGGGVPPADGP